MCKLQKRADPTKTSAMNNRKQNYVETKRIKLWFAADADAAIGAVAYRRASADERAKLLFETSCPAAAFGVDAELSPQEEKTQGSCGRLRLTRSTRMKEPISYALGGEDFPKFSVHSVRKECDRAERRSGLFLDELFRGYRFRRAHVKRDEPQRPGYLLARFSVLGRKRSEIRMNLRIKKLDRVRNGSYLHSLLLAPPVSFKRFEM
jgi:hypothetical protein